MRYLYQQLLAFLFVIFMTLMTSGIAFTQFTKQSLETSNYRQLFGYATAVSKVTSDLNESSNAVSYTHLTLPTKRIV